MKKLTIPFLVLFLLSCNPSPDKSKQAASDNTIQPSLIHPGYWAYQGKEVLLLGGSVEDNLFQIPDLEEHLDLLRSVGGNYVRNTMSSRDSGNVWPFGKNEEGKYDLRTWNDEYWKRFDNLLKLTAERNIIVQVEIWATFDFYRDIWSVNPFNPTNNVNYNERRSKLSPVIETHPIYTENKFFWSIPEQLAITPVLFYQSKFVDKLLSYSLAYDNVLYCMDNETSVTSDWGKFWSLYIQKKAREAGKIVYTTEMWDPWDLSNPIHSETFDHPETYGFVDISQNNHITGEDHWTNGLAQLKRLRFIDAVRPVNNVKVYGNDGGRHKTTRNGIESYIQNAFFGCAGTRFHRPGSGQGLNEIARAVIKSIRSLSDQMDWFNGKPLNGVLSEREEHEAYCRAIEGKEYAIYFPKGGSVLLDLSKYKGDFSVKWCDVLAAEWEEGTFVSGGRLVPVTAPGNQHWIALISK